MTPSNEYWLFHWTLAFSGGVFALLMLGWYWWTEDGKAISYFASLHGEDVDFSKIINRSSWFVGRVVKLEQEKFKLLKRQRIAALTHAFHPRTPFHLLCGVPDGNVVHALEDITCPTCKLLFNPDPFGTKAKLSAMDADGYPDHRKKS